MKPHVLKLPMVMDLKINLVLLKLNLAILQTILLSHLFYPPFSMALLLMIFLEINIIILPIGLSELVFFLIFS
jgi:hypothetical protein